MMQKTTPSKPQVRKLTIHDGDFTRGHVAWHEPLQGGRPYHAWITTHAGPAYLGTFPTLGEATEEVRQHT